MLVFPLLNVQRLDALLVRLVFYVGTEWLGFHTLFFSCNLLYQVIKELHIAISIKIFSLYQTKMHLSPPALLSPFTRLRKLLRITNLQP
ncbi:hypothetical protein COD84_30345 [Bacillus cereus]|nr:hypothetical protein COD84_30345 [Bacillus cereus]